MNRRSARRAFLLIAAIGGSTACSTGTHAIVQSRPAASDTLHVRSIEHIVGRAGTAEGGQYKITVPQNDLDVSVDGFRIIPPMGMGSWITFTPTAEGTVIMGDVVVREEEIGPVQRIVLEHGLTVTALHNHFVREEPKVMYMHIGGKGSEEELARGVKAVFDKVTELRGRDPAGAQAQTVPNTLGIAELARILGHEGEMSRGVYKITIGRRDVRLRAHGVPVTTFMGFNTWAAWQGSPERAAVAGDFAMLKDEVAPVIEALVENGIEVVAVHNHMVGEEPRIFFLHYWGVGPAEQLARGLKAALDQTGR